MMLIWTQKAIPVVRVLELQEFIMEQVEAELEAEVATLQVELV